MSSNLRLTEGSLSPGDDASDARFFSADDLPEEIGFAAHRRALRKWCADQRDPHRYRDV